MSAQHATHAPGWAAHLCPQEIEEVEFNPRTECENCLTEAQAKARELSARCVPEGAGPIAVIVSAPYYCRSTDALAGDVTIRIVRVADHAAAQALAGEIAAGFDEDDDRRVNIDPPVPRAPAPVSVGAAGSDDVPF